MNFNRREQDVALITVLLVIMCLLLLELFMTPDERYASVANLELPAFEAVLVIGPLRVPRGPTSVEDEEGMLDGNLDEGDSATRLEEELNEYS